MTTATARVAADPVNGSNFHSSGLRQKVDQLMDILWAGGVNNPMDSIEQISYLLFLRMLWERDELAASMSKKHKRLFSGTWARYGWGSFVTLTGDQLFDSLRGAIEKLHELPGLTTTGKELFNRATLKIYDRPTLRAVVQSINGIDLAEHESGGGVDLKGDMYEYLLSRLSTSGTNGQFRTPRHIIDMIVKLVDPKPGQRICDPAVGTAGFLVSAFNHILRTHTKKADADRGRLTGSAMSTAQWKFVEEQAFTGFDNDANMVKLAILNLYLHRLEKADIRHHNSVTNTIGGEYPGPMYEVILANPPFSGKVQEESINADLNHGLNTRATELLFLKWFMDHLTPNGRAGVIVPNGVLFGSTNAAKKLRQTLLEQFDLQAVISLPSGVFKPYAGVGTAALIFCKAATSGRGEITPRAGTSRKSDAQPATNGRGFTRSVWFYDITADGFSLDDKRTPIEMNDIPDVLEKFRGRAEGPNSYLVPIEKIIENEYSLAAGRYKPVTVESVHHDAPAKIINEVIALEQQIATQAKKLLAGVGR